MLLSQPATSCLTNHSELCMSRLLDKQSRRISIYRPVAAIFWFRVFGVINFDNKWWPSGSDHCVKVTGLKSALTLRWKFKFQQYQNALLLSAFVCLWPNTFAKHLNVDSRNHSVRKFNDSTPVHSHWSRPHNKYSLQCLYWNRLSTIKHFLFKK